MCMCVYESVWELIIILNKFAVCVYISASGLLSAYCESVN